MIRYRESPGTGLVPGYTLEWRRYGGMGQLADSCDASPRAANPRELGVSRVRGLEDLQGAMAEGLDVGKLAMGCSTKLSGPSTMGPRGASKRP